MGTRPRVASVSGLALALCLLAWPSAGLGGEGDTDDRVNALMLDLFSRDKATRLKAVEELGRVGGPRAINALRNALHKGDKDMREAAGTALVRALTKGATLTAEQFVAEEVVLRRAIMAIVAEAPPRDALGLLQAAAKDADPQVRARAASGLGHMPHAAALVAIKALQKDPVAAVRAAAETAEPRQKTSAENALLIARWAAICKTDGRAALAEGTLAKALKESISTKFKPRSLESVVEFLRETANLSVFVDWRQIATAGVKRSTEVAFGGRSSLKGHLNALSRRVGGEKLDWAAEGSIIFISRPAALVRLLDHPGCTTVLKPDANPTETAKTLKYCDERLPRLDFAEIPLELAVQFMREVSGLSIYVDWNALKTLGITRESECTVDLIDVTVERGLTAILHDAIGAERWRAVISGGVILISTHKAIARLRARPARPSVLKPDHDPKATADTLYRYKQTLPKLDLASVPLALAIQFMREVSGVSIYIRWSALNSPEVGPDTECNLHLVNVTFDQVLTMMIDDVTGLGRCGRVVCGGVIVVSTHEDLANLAKAKRPNGLFVTEAMILADTKAYLDRSAGAVYSGGCPLIWLAEEGRREAFGRVLGALDAKRRVKACRAVMIEAIENSAVKNVRFLLDTGFDLDQPMAGCPTALCLAARYGDAKVVSLLLSRGAKVNVSSAKDTPLGCAAERGSPEIVSLLIARGAKVNASTKKGTPLARARRELVRCQRELKGTVGERLRKSQLEEIARLKKVIARLKKVIEILRKHGGKDKP